MFNVKGCHMQLIYSNPLSCVEHLNGFRMEGPGTASFPQHRLRLESLERTEEGVSNQAERNFVLWCPVSFPSDIAVTWTFKPLREPGLAILFFAASGKDGIDLFDPSLKPRNGDYVQYHHGDMDALHLSYFRRRWEEERQFHTCNLRKSYGFHLVAQGADPLPAAEECTSRYNMVVIKRGGSISFAINELPVLQWEDDGQLYGPLLKGGKIGFRQMSPLIAEYSDLNVYKLLNEKE